MHVKNGQRHFITVLLIIFLPVLLQAQSLEKKADEILAGEKEFSGVVLLADKGTIKYHKGMGYRDYASRSPLLKTDLFELASVSKQFTAFIIISLQKDGILQYDELAEKYIDIPYKGITIRHLLTHTSGLPDYQQVMDAYWDKK